MTIALGANTVWRFFIAGKPATGAYLRFWNNDDRKQTQPAYRDAAGLNPFTEIRLDANGEPEGIDQIYFDSALTYYITVTNADNSIKYYEITGYTALGGGTPTVNAFYLDRNHAPNPQFYHHYSGVHTFTNDTEKLVAPPAWYFKRVSNSDPTDSITFEKDDDGDNDIGAQAESTPTFFLRYHKTANGATETRKLLYWKIPTSRAFASRSGEPINVTLKMDVKGDSAYQVDLFYQQNLGTAPGDGEQTLVTIDTENVTTGWTTISGTATIADLNGKTINDADDSIIFGVNITGLNSITGIFDVTNVQLFIGNDDITYIYSDPQYDNAMSLPIPAKPAATGQTSTDSGKQVTVDSSGNFIFAISGQVESNLIWGGDFTTNPWQEGAGAISSGTSENISTYVTDGYKLLTTDARANPNKFTISHRQEANAPAFADANYYTSHSLYMELTGNAQGTLAATDLIRMEHVIEGFDWVATKEQAFTLGFWCRSNRTGIFCVNIQNNGDTHSYTHEFEILQADTWEFKQFSVAAYTDAGGWDYTSGVGARISWTLAAGADHQIASADKDSWQAVSGKFATDAIVTTWASTANSNFYIALPQLHHGNALPPYQRVEPGVVYRKAQRYFEKSTPVGIALRGSALADSVGGIFLGHSANDLTVNQHTMFHNVYFNVEKRVVGIHRMYGVLGAVNTINNIATSLTGSPVMPSNAGAPVYNRATTTMLATIYGGTGGGGNVPIPDNANFAFRWSCDARF